MTSFVFCFAQEEIPNCACALSINSSAWLVLRLLSRGLKAVAIVPPFLLLFGSFSSRQACIRLVLCAFMIPVVSSILLVLAGCTANVISLENTLALRVLPSFIASVPAPHACARRLTDASTRLHS